MNTSRKPRVGLALGGGAARGEAHVGVILVLERAGNRPHLVCGTSIGALMGVAYAAGELEHFEQWLLGLSITNMFSFLGLSMNGGLIKGDRLMEFFRSNFIDRSIKDLAIPFAALATALHTGEEIWLGDGSTLETVSAEFLHNIFRHLINDCDTNIGIQHELHTNKSSRLCCSG